MEKSWFLEAIAADGSPVTYDVHCVPFYVGRDLGNELVVAALGLSRRHAGLAADASGHLRLDLDSMNGTFVNRARGSVALAEGVEPEDEAETCRAMGSQLIQGYLTGRPVPVQSV